MLYADYNGSAPLKTVVTEYLVKRLQDGPFSNPNAIHSLGKKMMFGMEAARRVVAKSLNCKSKNIIFNSGASEGISHIFYSLLNDGPKNGKNIILTSGFEHAAIVKCCELYEERGFKVLTINTTNQGYIDLEHLSVLISENKEQIALITAMAANNETGIIQPYQEVGKLSQDNGILYFSDTTQFIGKTAFDFETANMDFAVLSSHKVGALIGSGCIIAKEPTLLKPFIIGGGQEKGLRGGTQNYIGVETIAVAMKYFSENMDQLDRVAVLREKFEKNIKAAFPDVVIIGDNSNRLSSTTMISYPGIHGQAVQIELESQNIFVTTSSACSDNNPETSRVLKSMGTTDDIGRGVIRISLCLNSNEALYEQIEVALTNAYTKLSKIKSF
jgi:cysteine desulfurase